MGPFGAQLGKKRRPKPLTAGDGRPVPAGRLRVERVLDEGDGRRTFVFSYLPEVVPPGDYTLRVGFGEAGGFAQSFALLRFRAE